MGASLARTALTGNGAADCVFCSGGAEELLVVLQARHPNNPAITNITKITIGQRDFLLDFSGGGGKYSGVGDWISSSN